MRQCHHTSQLTHHMCITLTTTFNTFCTTPRLVQLSPHTSHALVTHTSYTPLTRISVPNCVCPSLPQVPAPPIPPQPNHSPIYVPDPPHLFTAGQPLRHSLLERSRGTVGAPLRVHIRRRALRFRVVASPASGPACVRPPCKDWRVRGSVSYRAVAAWWGCCIGCVAVS